MMQYIKQLPAVIFLFINLLLVACTTTTVQHKEKVPVEDRSVTDTTYKENATTTREIPGGQTEIESNHPGVDSEFNDYGNTLPGQTASPVALAFLNDADKYTTAGDSDRAVASLERGLDIEPKNPWLWNRLAAERLKQGMWTKAITLAKKSNAFAAGNNQLRQDNWRIIAKSRSALGDEEGAKKAMEMIRRFSRERT